MIVGVAAMKNILSKKAQLDFVVSITEEGRVHPEILDYPHLQLSFYDITEADSFGAVGPSMADIEKLANLPRTENILFHCTAGYSRSSAAAVIHYMSMYGSEQRAYDRTVQIVEDCFEKGLRGHPYICPNLRMIALADEFFQSGGRLIEVAKKNY